MRAVNNAAAIDIYSAILVWTKQQDPRPLLFCLQI